MTRFAVQHAVFPAINSVATRQADHFRAIRSYVESTTDIGTVCGPILRLLLGQYAEARTTALTGLDQGVEICETIAERATLTGQQYATADETCVNDLRTAASGAIDVSGITYCQPGTGGSWGPGTGTGPGGTGPLFPAEMPGLARSSLPGWDDPLGDARRPVSILQTFTDRSLGRISPGVSDFTKPVSIKAPFDKRANGLVDRFWQWRDNTSGIPGATASLRDQYNLRQAARFGAAYNATYSRTLNDQIVPGRGHWVEQNMGPRTAQAGILVMSTVTEWRKAWGNVVSLGTAVERSSVIEDVANGPANTDSIDWARQP